VSEAGACKPEPFPSVIIPAAQSPVARERLARLEIC
jgi:hypothetical protein